MPETLVRRVLLKVAGDDADAEAKIDAISKKADELAAKHPELQVRINTAAASAKVTVLRQELRDLAEAETRAEDMTFTAGDMQALRTIDGLKTRIDELAARSADIKLKADDKAARAELLRFQVKADELSRKVIDPKFELRGVLKAQAELAALDAEMDRIGSKAGGGGFFSRLRSGLGGAASSIPVGGMFGAGTLLALVPAGEAVLTEVTGLVSGFAAAGAGAGAFALLAMPAFKSVSGAYTQIKSDQQAYDRALTKTARNTALAHLKQDWAGLSGPQRDAVRGVQGLAGEYHKLSDAFTPEAFKVFNGLLKLAGEVLPDVAPFAKTFADSISGLLGKASGFAGSKGFGDWLKQFHSLEGPAITAIGTGIGKVAGSIGKLLTAMSSKDVVNAINIAFGVVAGTIKFVTYMVKRLMDNWDGMSVAVKHSWYDIKRWTDDVTHVFDKLRHAAAGFGHDWAHYFDVARHDVASFAHGVARDFDSVRHHAAELGHDIATWFSRIRHDIAHWADDVRHDTDKVVGWFRGLPGRIASALADLPGLLFRGGQHAISRLLDGLRSIPVVGTIAGIAGDIADHLPHSPARRGPLSGTGDPLVSGRVIGQRLAQGIETSRPRVSAAMSRALGAGTAGRAGAVTAGAAAAAQQPKITIQLVGGDREFRIWLKKQIRVTGGNVQVVGA